MVFFLRRLLSRPENWLPEEHARVQVWDNVLSKSHICSLWTIDLVDLLYSFVPQRGTRAR